MIHRISTAFVAVCLASIAQAATLEVPTPNTTVSGIGVISGWKCDVDGPLTVRFNGDTPIPLVYGSERADTRGVCGDTNNGFVTIWNWGNLGDGQYTAVVYDNGQEFARSTFRVVTTGEEFLRGASGACEIPDFPAPGETARFKWNQSTQHLELDSVSDVDTPEPLAQGKLYWMVTYDIQRANLDGSQVETLISGQDEPANLAFDPTRGKLYWTAYRGSQDTIQRANLDGSQVETLVIGQGELASLALDTTGASLYWAVYHPDGYSSIIQRANLDGSQVETVFIIPDLLAELAVAPIGGKLYWTVYHPDGYKYAIQRSNLDGSQVETLVIRADLNVYRIGDLDLTDGKLYWTAHISSTTTGSYKYAIQRANLDGSQIETVFSSPDRPWYLAVDPIGGKLYWTVHHPGGIKGEIRRANFDGSQIETLVTDLVELGSLALALK